MQILETLARFWADTGFAQFHWTNGLMIAVGLLFIYLAIKKGFEPLLLVPIGFGILVGNIPYDVTRLPLSVYDGPVSRDDLAAYQVTWIGETPPPALDPRRDPRGYIPIDLGAEIADPVDADRAVRDRAAVLINHHQYLSPRGKVTEPGIYPAGGGRSVLVGRPGDQGRYPEVWDLARQDVKNASVFWWLFAGVGLAGFYPPLIFLGIGALIDFGPMLANPKTLLLGAAAQFGIFAALFAAVLLGFDLKEAASIGIIGGADGPTAIFTCTRLAPDLLGAVALAAYSYMAMVPIIQPPVIKLLTTRAERRIRMKQLREVPQSVKTIFPAAGFLVTAFVSPGALPLLGMLFFGNLLRESLVTSRLMKTAQGPFIDIITMLLGVTVGAKTTAANFLTLQTIYIFILGVTAFALATAGGVLCGKLMNVFSKEKINPMIGAAGVSAVPMSARVVHKLGQEEDPQNFLIMHAMGPNVAGVIGSALAAGVLLSQLSG